MSQRRQLERLAIELSAAIRNEARGQHQAAAFYWRRARRCTGDTEVKRWCAERAAHSKSLKVKAACLVGSGGNDGVGQD